MGDAAWLVEVLALPPQETREPMCGEHHRSAGRRHLSLSIFLQCRLCIHKPLSVKHFHQVAAGNAKEYSLTSRIGNVSILENPLYSCMMLLWASKLLFSRRECRFYGLKLVEFPKRFRLKPAG
jgi:hypothetical protein